MPKKNKVKKVKPVEVEEVVEPVVVQTLEVEPEVVPTEPPGWMAPEVWATLTDEQKQKAVKAEDWR